MPKIRLRVAALLLLCSSLAAAGEPPPEEWYVISIGDQPVGSLRTRTRVEPEGIRSEAHTELVLNRLGTRVEMATTSTSLETAAGALRSAGMELKMSAQVTSIRAEVAAGEVRVRSSAGGQSFEHTVAYQGELVGTDSIRRATLARLLRPGDRLEAQTFSAELGAVATVTRTLVARDDAGLRVEETVSGVPGKQILWLDLDGRAVKIEAPGPFGTMTISRGDPAAARRAGAAGGELPDEVYAATIVRTQVRLPEPRRLDWLRVRLRQRRPELGWPDLERPGQRVIARDERELVLEIARPRPAWGHRFPVAPSDENREYLAPSAYVQSGDPELRAKALAVVGDEQDLLRAALRLRRWVAESMTMDLGIAAAPSTEIWKDRRGTCVAYATLLTTMARAVGIPARLVMGYAYVDGMFAGHAWTEVLAGDRWLPLDAALVGPDVADAARFALLASSLRDGPAALNGGAALQLFGNLELAVLGYGGAGGPRVRVAAGARPYRVDGRRYENPGLGVRVAAPPGFRFTDLDGVWPDRTLVALTDGDDRVALEARARAPWDRADPAQLLAGDGRRRRLSVAGRPAWIREGEREAAVVVPAGDTLWLLRATGPEARAAVRRVAAGLRL